MKKSIAFFVMLFFYLITYSQRRYFKNFMPLNQKIKYRLKKVSYYENSNKAYKVEDFVYDDKGRVKEIIKNKRIVTKITYSEPKFIPEINKKYSKYESKIDIKSTYDNVDKRITLHGKKKNKMNIKNYYSKSENYVSSYEYGHERISRIVFSNGIVHSSNSFNQNYRTKEYVSMSKFYYNDKKVTPISFISKFERENDTLIKIKNYSVDNKIETMVSYADVSYGIENDLFYIRFTFFSSNNNIIRKVSYVYDSKGMLRMKWIVDDTGKRKIEYTYEKGKGNATLFVYKFPKNNFNYDEYPFKYIVPFFPNIL